MDLGTEAIGKEDPMKEKDPVSLPPKIRRALDDFLKSIIERGGDNLKSVFLYGSAARDEFIPGRSDVNLLIVLEKVGQDFLESIAPILKRAMRNDLWPIVLSKDEFLRSFDVFPIEWFELKEARVVLYGDDILERVEVEREDLRRQLEFEARGKLIRLRQAYIRDIGKEKALVELASRSIPSFLPLFKAALFLRGGEIPRTDGDLVEAAIKEFSLDREGLEWGFKARSGPVKGAKRMFPLYLRAIEQFVDFIDRWKLERG